MTHDIQDLLNLIKELEERLVKLEIASCSSRDAGIVDNWYWDH